MTNLRSDDVDVAAGQPAPARDAGIRVRDLVVDFAVRSTGDAQVRGVDGVTFEVHDGELVVLVGRSGCGKTTVLNVLAGLQGVTSGTVTLAGLAPRQARGQVGYMFARDGLMPWRTAIRNVEFALEIRHRGLKRQERRKRAGEHLQRLGIGHAASKYPWQLSQGMRQRVALARTWVTEPDVILMDEPFAALDAQTRASVQEEFLSIWGAQRRTSVFVTHELKEAILLADRVLVMHSGRIVDEVVIDIPRPRQESSLEEHPRYRDLHHRLVAGLNEHLD